jgi:hypothetical protein
MRQLRYLFNPVVALIAIQVVWITLVVFWIYWFIGKHASFEAWPRNTGLNCWARGTTGRLWPKGWSCWWQSW